MHTTSPVRTGSPAGFGVLLVIIGIVALALQQSGVDVIEAIDRAGWPFFVIIPGMVLLAAAWIPAPPNGLGFAIGGAVVMTIGLILMYADTSGHWERWAYMWALLPGAAGAATVVYGIVAAQRQLVLDGLRTVLIAAVLLVAGMWFFEATFETGQAPVDFGTWWPVVLIGIGLLVTLSAVFSAPRGRPTWNPTTSNAPAISEEKPE
jgi:hypothetical protein